MSFIYALNKNNTPPKYTQMFLRVVYIRRFLHALNKSRVQLTNTSVKHLNEALNYKVQTVFKSIIGDTLNTITVTGVYEHRYITHVQCTVVKSSSSNNLSLYVNKLCTFLHKIQWVSDIPLTLDMQVDNMYIIYSSYGKNGAYFKHPLPLSLFGDRRISLRFRPQLPSALVMYQSVSDTTLNSNRVYFWTPKCKVNVHSLQLNPPSVDEEFCSVTNVASSCCTNITRCKCKYFHVHKKNTLIKYTIPEHLLR